MCAGKTGKGAKFWLDGSGERPVQQAPGQIKFGFSGALFFGSFLLGEQKK
jgi:hypothetical protein